MAKAPSQRTIPRCMATQHPDNVLTPFFASGPVLRGEEEVKEAYYSFSHLGCDEQMWDYEGKEVDSQVVLHLLSGYPYFFQEKVLGEDLFLTIRIPNPSIEKEMRKVLVETLESIPRSFDIAASFYGRDVPPIFEVILPMTMSARDLNRVYHYYRGFVAGKQGHRLGYDDIFIWEWVGKFLPETIQVIPLVEDLPYIVRADRIVEDYVWGKDLAYVRVFLARSDPALNYGMVSAVLANKVAMYRLRLLEKRLGIPLYPILGAGTPPFRGNLRPGRIERCLAEYPSTQTFTIQSAFRYDYPALEAQQAIAELRSGQRGEPTPIEEGRAQEIMDRCSREYRKQVMALAPLVNRVASLVPQRRDRRLHIGLFGYSRQMEGVALPRAITFCASLYSVGFPPEFLGLTALTTGDLEFLRQVYPSFVEDLRDASRFRNPEAIKSLAPDFWPLALDGELAEVNKEHARLTQQITEGVKDRADDLDKVLVEAAHMRRFLG